MVKAVRDMESSSISTCQYSLFRSKEVKIVAPPKQSKVSSIWAKLYASLMVLAFKHLKSMQNHKDPSFFLMRTTALAQGLLEHHIAPTSNISLKWFFTSSNKFGGILRYLSLKGV